MPLPENPIHTPVSILGVAECCSSGQSWTRGGYRDLLHWSAAGGLASAGATESSLSTSYWTAC